jgi:diaminopimelate epimerase
MTDELRFAKYVATGNDFVMLTDLDDERPLDADEVVALCDRRTGIGADGVIRVVRADRHDAAFLMDYRNADGSPAEMCGNGARCVGRLARDAGLTEAEEFGLVTGGGVRRVRSLADGRVAVEMGAPAFERGRVPMRGPSAGTFMGEPLDLGDGTTVKATAVSMGNPHLVLFVEEVPARIDVGRLGPELERHELFPERTNVEFALIVEDGIEARVWERGSGETMACGSGACAIVVAANEAGLLPARAVVRFPGGPLEVERRSDGEVVLTGEARRVFAGAVDLDALTIGRTTA